MYETVEVETTPKYKKYGYNPDKLNNPTIWRQQVMKVTMINHFSKYSLTFLFRKRNPARWSISMTTSPGR